MNKTLTIPVYQDPTPHIEQFLESWKKIGTIEQLSDLSFSLVSNDNKSSTLTLDETQITLIGNIPSRCLMFIDTLAKACEADKILEGEVIDKNQPKFNESTSKGNPFGNNAQVNFEMPLGMKSALKISTLSKTKLIILLILALPLLLIILPIIFIITIIKIIRFKLKF